MNRRGFLASLLAAAPVVASIGAIARLASKPKPEPEVKSSGRMVWVIDWEDIEVGTTQTPFGELKRVDHPLFKFGES